MKKEVIYYYVLEVNNNNNSISKHFQDLTESCTKANIVMFASKNFNEYQTCIQNIIDSMNTVLGKLKEDKSRYQLHWEKQDFSKYINEDGTVKNNDDIIEDYWMMNEAAKISVVDNDSRSEYKQWIMKSRIFFKDGRLIAESPNTIQ